MIKIYHNNRCSKSRLGVAFLEELGKEFEIIKYLEDVPTASELKNIISLLGVKPIDLVRKNEAIWKSDFKGKELSNDDIVEAMVNHPKLIERPIIINGDKAVIGRPTENISKII
ncbi:arsenate reductase (glutaredoxin) [Gaetbulibacter saemankumensis]|uniref:arsenate reductase (glutaredoxin) n=1 Tax=Gaetbulibacter saemankumensis TaxID=311208 RepID=UPI000481A72E|nr:arsenate reductase (glutaredoxin) [Gaetbulibacter saemankumensis]